MSDSDPIDDYLEDKEKLADARESADMEAFHAWKADPNKQNTSTLLKRFNPMFSQRVSMWKAPAVDEAAFRADLKRHALTAFETFDPSRGAQLRTHVGNLLRRSQRFNSKYQNVAFIPEEQAALITPIQQARDFLFQEKGEQPSHEDIASYLNENEDMLPKRVRGKMTPQRVLTVQQYQIRDIPGSAFESDPTPKSMSFERETIDVLRPALKTEDEKTVYDYLFGKGGKPHVESTGEIARRMGKSPSQISRLKKRIESTYKKYVG
jgi:DNA-directed RNA polymerase specialized sigma subunit